MLQQLYDASLKQLKLVECVTKKGTTLEEVINNSKYVFFAIIRASSEDSEAILKSIGQFQKNKGLNNAKNTPQTKIKNLFRIKPKKEGSGSVYSSTVIINIDFNSNLNINMGSNLTYILPEDTRYVDKGRLLRALNVSRAPSIILVESGELTVLSVNGCDYLNGEEQQFPWCDPPTTSLFDTKFLQSTKDNSSESTVTKEVTLPKCVKGIYFGAKWCPPCKALTSQLKEFYKRIKESDKDFEIIFCSFDRTKESYGEHIKDMPWLCFSFGDQRVQDVRRAYDVNGIPSFILVDEDNNLITKHGKNSILSDPSLIEYPWKARELYELNEFTVQRLTDLPSLIMFTEGAPEDSVFAKQVLSSCSSILYSQLLASEEKSVDSENNPKTSAEVPPTPMQVFYTGEHPICDYVIDSLGLEEMELPLLVICDTLMGIMAICDRPEVSDSTVIEFMNEYRSGKAAVVPLPKLKHSTSSVAGIPLEKLEHVLDRNKT